MEGPHGRIGQKPMVKSGTGYIQTSLEAIEHAYNIVVNPGCATCVCVCARVFFALKYGASRAFSRLPLFFGALVQFSAAGYIMLRKPEGAEIVKKYGGLHNLTENGVKKVLKKLKESGSAGREKGTGKGRSVVTDANRETARQLYARGYRKGRHLANVTHAHAKALTGGALYAPAIVWSVATLVGPMGFPRVAGLGGQAGGLGL